MRTMTNFNWMAVLVLTALWLSPTLQARPFVDDLGSNPIPPDNYRLTRSQASDAIVTDSRNGVILQLTAAEQDDPVSLELVSDTPDQLALSASFRWLDDTQFSADGLARFEVSTNWKNALSLQQHATTVTGNLVVSISLTAHADGRNIVETCWQFRQAGQPDRSVSEPTVDGDSGCNARLWSFDRGAVQQLAITRDPQARSLTLTLNGQQQTILLHPALESRPSAAVTRRVDVISKGDGTAQLAELLALDRQTDLGWIVAQSRYNNVHADYRDDPLRSLRWQEGELQFTSVDRDGDKPTSTALTLTHIYDAIAANTLIRSDSSLGPDGDLLRAQLVARLVSDVPMADATDTAGSITATLALQSTSANRQPRLVYCLYRNNGQGKPVTGLLGDNGSNCITSPTTFDFDTFYPLAIELNRAERRIVFRAGDVIEPVLLMSDLYPLPKPVAYLRSLSNGNASAVVLFDNIRNASEARISEARGDLNFTDTGGAHALPALAYSSGGGCSLGDSRSLNLFWCWLIAAYALCRATLQGRSRAFVTFLRPAIDNSKPY